MVVDVFTANDEFTKDLENRMKHKILILTNSIGGLYSFRKEVVTTIINNGFEVVISCPSGDMVWTDFFKGIGCIIISTGFDGRGTNAWRELLLFGRYLKLLRSIRPAIVLTYTIKPNVYGGIAARFCSVPQIANITGLGDAIENPGLLRKITILLYRFGLGRTKMVFYQNTSIQEFCKNMHIGGKGFLLPGSGVNLEWHTQQKYPAESSKMIFNFIGRVLKDKGIEEYIEMAQILGNKYPQTEFHIIGQCSDKYVELLRQKQEEDVVIWHGPVSDVRSYIKDSWCTIHPSYHEGMSNVLLETCAAGRPAIACDINGCREIIDDGVNGYLCKAKDAADLTQKVERFINIPYTEKAKMGQYARMKVEREFNRQIVVKAYLDLINSIC